jgi:inner membrane protein
LDNATHTLTGYFLSRAGLNRLTPNATAILLLSANAPDIDILALAGGSLNYFHFHRHLTHSLAFAPVLAAVAVLLVRVIGRKSFPLAAAFVVAVLGVLSHLLLDLTNEYGIRLLLPFSHAWLHWDLTSIIDVWILTAFALCLIAPLVSNLVGQEIGSPQKRKYPGRGFAWLALAFLTLYDAGRWVSHTRALAVLESRVYDGASALRVAAFPQGSNPFRWRGLAETENAYQFFDVPVLSTPDPAAVRVIFKAEPSAAIEAAGQTEEFRIFKDFAIYPLWRAVPADSPEGATRVVLTDIRFPFSVRAITDQSNFIKNVQFSFGR